MTSKYKAQRLNGKVAVITAATLGIGLATAERLGHEGCRVVISSRKQKNVDEAIRSLVASGLKQENVVGIECHVGNEAHRQRLLDFAVKSFGKIDFLINNAGINPSFGWLTELQESEWNKLFDVNVKAAFLLTRAVVPIMKQNGGGCVIFNASTGAYQPPPMIAAYGLTKTALLALTKTLATELAPFNIRINAVSPGLIRTKMSQPLLESETIKEEGGVNDMKRVGDPHEVAAAISYLVSNDASYVTGESMIVSGGTDSRL
ncbi:hypothetical protein M3Y94_00851600 [Aphelenchoides besseyi]|nr:hypothetical protein M3Y94_00851600 [Aphelenchoides besseyi]